MITDQEHMSVINQYLDEKVLIGDKRGSIQHIQTRFYNRETFATLSYEIFQIRYFLNSKISANHDKVDGLSTMVKSL